MNLTLGSLRFIEIGFIEPQSKDWNGPEWTGRDRVEWTGWNGHGGMDLDVLDIWLRKNAGIIQPCF